MIREFEFHLSLSAYISNGIFVLINTVFYFWTTSSSQCIWNCCLIRDFSHNIEISLSWWRFTLLGKEEWLFILSLWYVKCKNYFKFYLFPGFLHAIKYRTSYRLINMLVFFLFEDTTQRYTLMRGFRNFKIFTVGGGVQRLFCLRGAIGTGGMRPILLLLY